jgi:formylglycine-generating enzyme required for sulfatase activity
MIEVPAGPFVSGGVGDPPSGLDPDDLPEERIVDLPLYWIDRTEVTNGAYRLFAGDMTGVPVPAYPDTDDLAFAGADAYPASDMTWTEARSYCRFLGKELPTAAQWEKAMRGGLWLGADRLNPHPRRNLPWGVDVEATRAKVRGVEPGGPVPAGSSRGDESPLGILDLAGNLQEWTSSVAVPRKATPAASGDRTRFKVTRGCNWDECNAANLAIFISIPNPRSVRQHSFAIGFRCALSPGTSDR